ncbi:MAG TPA: hypothetical protein VFX21_01650 [Acidimicrobiia bacterium]|nr:hypothetical protein [Acidimicrobiia bacterium]
MGQEGGVVRWGVPMRLGRRYRAAADARVLGQTCLVELVMGSSPMVRHVFTVTGAGRCDSYVNCATSVPSRWRSFVDTRALMQSRPRVISGLAQRAEWLESAPDTSYVAPRRSYGSAVAGRRYR